MKWYVIPRDKTKGYEIIFSGTRQECLDYVKKNWGDDWTRNELLPGEGETVSETVLEIRERKFDLGIYTQEY